MARLVAMLIVGGAACGDDAPAGGTTGLPASSTGTSTASVTTGSSDGEGPGTADPDTSSTEASGQTTTVSSTSTSGGIGTDTDASECGNESIDEGEACDDGNELDGDGCNRDCVISGTLLWTHTHASALGTDYGWAVTTDDAGNPYVAGAVATPTAEDIWLRSYSAAGGLGWTVEVDGPSAALDRGHGIAYHDGGLFTAGRVTSGSGDDIWIGHYELSGNTVWTTSVSSALVDGLGQPIPGNDQARAIAVGPDGNPFVVGWFAVTGAGVNAWVRKLDPAGAEIWTMTHNGDASGNDQLLGVAVDSAGAVVVAGWEQTVAEARNVFVRKYDSDGGVSWTVSRDGGMMGTDEAHAVAVGDDDTIVVVGSLTVDEGAPRWWVGKYDTEGIEQWSIDDPGETEEGALARGVAVDSNGQIVVVGHQTLETVNQTIVRKYDADGDELWTQGIESPVDGATLGLGVTIADDGSIYAVGCRNMGIDGQDAWIAKFAP